MLSRPHRTGHVRGLACLYIVCESRSGLGVGSSPACPHSHTADSPGPGVSGVSGCVVGTSSHPSPVRRPPRGTASISRVTSHKSHILQALRSRPVS